MTLNDPNPVFKGIPYKKKILLHTLLKTSNDLAIFA